MRYLVFLAMHSNSRTLTKYTIFFSGKLPHPFSTYLVKIHIFH